MKTILIQGAMDTEVSIFLEKLKPSSMQRIAGFEFYFADYKGVQVIISKTGIGIINASTATTIALLRFKPDIVINQGCAGSADKNIGVGQILVGGSAVYINDFKTPPKQDGYGSNSLEWSPTESRSYIVNATDWLLDKASYFEKLGRCLNARLGSGDLFSRECDRINYLHSLFGHSSEDMETVASYKICEDFGVSHIAFRIISNNELTLQPKDKSTYAEIQRFVMEFVDKLIED